MGINLDRLLDVLDRAHNGPVLQDDDFNLKVIPGAISGVLKKYGLMSTVDLDNPINTDDDLADRFYQAGFEAAIMIGLMCKDTNRLVKFSEQELQGWKGTSVFLSSQEVVDEASLTSGLDQGSPGCGDEVEYHHYDNNDGKDDIEP